MEKVGSSIPEIQHVLPFAAETGMSEHTTSRAKLTRSMRLNTYEVANVLKRGKRVRAGNVPQTAGAARVIIAKPGVDAKVFARIPSGGQIESRAAEPSMLAFSQHHPRQHRPRQNGARLAIAVPKRVLKKSVDRNLVKRWMREALRQHHGRAACVDLLLTLTAKFNLKKRDDRLRVKAEIQQQLSLALVVGTSSTLKNLPSSS